MEPHYDLHLRYSRDVRKIYKRYSDFVEPFGMDECWIGVGRLKHGTDEGRKIAEEISTAIKEEIGLTVSVGVSFTKTFAKLGSDMKKPDGITVIGRENFRDTVWKLPVSELLYVGRSTAKRLSRMFIYTIGDLANADVKWLQSALGKNGLMLYAFANGLDNARVAASDFVVPVKSIGHGSTGVEDLENDYAVWLALLELTQEIGKRLRLNGLCAKGVQLVIKDNTFACREHQMRLPYPTQSPLEIAQAAYAMFKERYRWLNPVRALTVRSIALEDENAPFQPDMFGNFIGREKRKALEDTVYDIRKKFGKHAIYPASLMEKQKKEHEVFMAV